jgi:ABC-2 type transport system permease protein
MREARRVAAHLRFVHLAFVRNPAAAIFTLVFPLGLLVVLTTLLRDGTIDRDGVAFDRTTYHVVAMAVFGLISATYTNVAMTMTLARERGVLKRLRGTPLPIGAVVAARVVHASLVAVVLVAVTSGYGVAIDALEVPSVGNAAALAGITVLSAACFTAIGLAVSTYVPDAAAAPPLVNGLLFPILLLSGVFVPIGDDAPGWVGGVANIFPVEPAFDLALAAVVGGANPVAEDVLVLLAWAGVAAVIAVRRFRWEPAA